MSNWFEVAIEHKYIKLFEYKSFQNWKVIGRGGFGTVYSAYSKDVEKTIALKSLYCEDNDNDTSPNGLIKELKNITRVSHHDNIVRFFGITQDPNIEIYYMVLQFANNGDLRCYLRNHFSELDWATKIRMAKDISSGINCLHNTNIVHRDLHDRNVLVHDDPFKYKRDESSDIYSLGLLFWELSSGIPPFKNISNPANGILHVINGERETPINGTPADFMNIYRDAWNGDPNLRPSIAEIRNRLNNMQMIPINHGEQDSTIDISIYNFPGNIYKDTSIDISSDDNSNSSTQDINSIGFNIN
ncbi:kinase-like protein [Gigaspora margarita]|uniref:Kinase-like protein n=2 Tax=Gigaspora margarita TaxID=4874 RepID=A0A8H4AQ13_GIGMA|nr:kinase-like protein [Gigaspora margarita]